MRRLAVLLALLGACGDDSAPAGDAADAGGDAALPQDASSGASDVGADETVDLAMADAMDQAVLDMAVVDQGVVDQAVMDGGPDSLGDTCEDACAMTALEASAGAARAVFDLAFFGVNDDGTLYIEAYGGAEPECPTMMTPSPDRTLIIGSVERPEDTMEVDSSAVLFDFEGLLTDAPLVRSTAGTLRARAIDLMPVESGFVRLDVDYTLGEIRIRGPLYATYCASLDG